MRKPCVFVPAIIASLFGAVAPVRAAVRGYEVRREEVRIEFEGGHEVPEALLRAELRRLLGSQPQLPGGPAQEP